MIAAARCLSESTGVSVRHKNADNDTAEGSKCFHLVVVFLFLNNN